jgi:hypothetical protein
MASIGAEYSGDIQPSLITQAKENMTGLPGYLSILIAKIRFFGRFWEKRSVLDRRPTKFEGKSAFGQSQGTSL